MLATTFIKEGKVMIALASWADQEVNVKLDINWSKLKIDKTKAKLYFPEMSNLQAERTLSVGDIISIPKEGGALLILE